jgi:cytoskeletal protein RodZ
MDLQPRPVYAGGAPVGRMEARRLGQARLAAKRRRAWRIRRIVLAFSVAVFVAMFATIYVQLASGHDPALTASSKTAAVTAVTQTSSAERRASGLAAAGSSNSASAGSTEASTGSTEASSSQASSSETSSTPSTVTTRQS